MSKTLFWYIFRDLLKIFLMTSGVLAGIFSFAGLLKPLMQYGLSGSQMAQMLGHLMPAMQTFTLPIAALFATTMVYGRLSADNELTACRATGISFGILALPAFILGLTLSLVALLSLSFLVPRSMLKAEKIAFSSLAEVIRKNVEREHKIKLPDQTIYAEYAEILPPRHDAPDDEVIVLYKPIFCSLETAPAAGMIDATGRPLKGAPKLPVPSEFYTARYATVVIHQAKDASGKETHVEVSARLTGGVMFPRKLEGESIGGVNEAQFGPVEMPSPIRENTTFMTVEQLQALHLNPLLSREVRAQFAAITRQDQERRYIEEIRSQLADKPVRGVHTPGRRHEYLFTGSDDASFRLQFEPGVKLSPRTPGKLVFSSTGTSREIRLELIRGGQVMETHDARVITIKTHADQEHQRMQLEFVLEDVRVETDQGSPGRTTLTRYHSVPMPPEILKVMKANPEVYVNKKDDEGARFRRKFTVLRSGITAEIQWRISFAISCLILVMIGCALGMMFRTGNFLSAFALSVVPALFCLVLMITGKHVSEQDAKNLKLGLTLIWSGNAIVLALATALLAKLHRT